MPPARPRRIAHKTIYSGRVFRVERDDVLLSNGRRARMEAVRHRGSVVLIVQPSPREIILVRQYRYVAGRWMWELPAGTLEPGEALIRAARRECQEEVGWRPKRIRALGMYYPSPGFCDERMHFYLCTDLVRPARPLPMDPDEQIEPKTFRLSDVRALAAAGDIVDMKTLAGLALVERARTGPK